MFDLVIIREVGPPRTHENGFIQIDLPDRWRLHVWPEARRIKKQATDSPIHDHVWAFQSWILLGNLVDTLYDPRLSFVAGGPFQLYDVVNGKLDARPSWSADPKALAGHHLKAGSSYSMPAGVFHETTWSGLAVSLMHREQQVPGSVRVLGRWGEPPDNAFDRATANPQSLLWDIVDESIHEILTEKDWWERLSGARS